MTLTRKRTTHTSNRATPRHTPAVPDSRQMLNRIDAMIRELEAMRRQISAPPTQKTATGLTDKLFGAAGHGTLDEYDMDLDWKRFREWEFR